MKYFFKEKIKLDYRGDPYRCKWGIQLTNDKKFLCHIHIFKSYLYTDSWRPGGHYYSMFFRNKWEFVREHMYYDGPHDWLSLGYLKFAWSRNCKKCYEVESSEEDVETNLFKIGKLWLKKKFTS